MIKAILWFAAKMTSKGKIAVKPHQRNQNEPFSVTEEAEAEMIAAENVFEPPLVPCTTRLRDLQKRMTGAELALQPGEIADRERKRRQNKQV